MLRWCRIQGARVSAALLLSLAALGGSHVLPHADDCHEGACAVAAVAHDASAHRARGATPDANSHPLHCLVCHWVRSFRPTVEVRIVSAPAVHASARVYVEFFTAFSAALDAQPPLRSPPISPFA